MASACTVGDKTIEIVGLLFDSGSNSYLVSSPVEHWYRNTSTEAAASGSVKLLRLFAVRGIDLCSDVHHKEYTLPVCAATVSHQSKAPEFLLQGGFYSS